MTETAKEQARTTGYAIFLHCHWCKRADVGAPGAIGKIERCKVDSCALHTFRPKVRPFDS